mgnify:CR=1 FL=1
MNKHTLTQLGLSLAMLTTAVSCAEIRRSPKADNFVDVRQQLAEEARELPTQSTQEEVSATYTPILPVSGEVPLSPHTAIVAALQNQPALLLEKLNPQIRETYVQQQQAQFDPVLGASIQAGRSRAVSPDLPAITSRQETVSGSVGVSQFLPTGTSIGLSTSLDYADRLEGTRGSYGAGVDLSITQSLLRGAGVKVNLASLRQARIDLLASEYELRGYVTSLVQEVENTYWDYALAKRRIEIYNESLNIAKQQLDEARELVNVGKLAEVELAAAEAEVALRNEDLINANANLQTLALQLLRLVGPTQPDLWDRPITLLTEPFEPQGIIDPVADHVALAMKMRPDLNQARLQIQRGDLELIKTRNGLLPRLDLFIALGKSGYARSFGSAYNNITTSSSYDALVGLDLQYPLGNRDAQGQHRRAQITRQQAALSLENLERLAIVDVRSAYIQLDRTRQQITATAATRRLQEVTLNNETEKFRLGKSTSLLVAQAQRDLLAAQIEEVNSVVSHLKAAVNLFAEEGSLLERRGIVAPGAKGVDGLYDWKDR